MHLGEIETKKDPFCPVCERHMEKVLDLKRYPLTELYEPYDPDRFDDEGYVDQGLLFCDHCSHAKLETIISPAFLYSHYRTTTAVSVGSMTAIANFRRFIAEHVDVGQYDAIIDIGANDVTLLASFGNGERQLIAIDPNTDRTLGEEHGIVVVNDFIEDVDLAGLCRGRALFLASHTLEHIERPSSMLRQLYEYMGPDDLCIFQFPSLDLLVADARIDQVHHQHVNYFSQRSIAMLLAKIGFELVTARFDTDHYGALMIIFRKASGPGSADFGPSISSKTFRARKEVFNRDISAANLRIEANPGPMVAFGAGLMLPLVAYYLPALAKVDCVVDDDRTKDGLRFVNFNKEIVHSSKIALADKDVVVTALATKLALRRILGKLFAMKVGNVIVPLHQM
jgi:hypothetical protein